LLRLQRDLQAVKLLIIDELGYVPLSPTGAELLFETFWQRYERGSTIVTSSLPFEDWTSYQSRSPWPCMDPPCHLELRPRAHGNPTRVSERGRWYHLGLP